jgi:hypothetical protein
MNHVLSICAASCALSSGAWAQADARTFESFEFESLCARLEHFVAPAQPESASFAAQPQPATTAASTAIAPAPQPPQVGSSRRLTNYTWQPEYWISVGGYWVDGRYDTPNDFDYDEATTLDLNFGLYNWRGEMGLGLEGGLMFGSYDIQGDSVGAGADSVDVWRGMLGIRVADRGPDDAIWIPFARAGFLYRRDEGDTVRDDGIGWYAGLGVDFRITQYLALGVSGMFNEAQSRNSQEWLFGLQATFGF